MQRGPGGGGRRSLHVVHSARGMMRASASLSPATNCVRPAASHYAQRQCDDVRVARAPLARRRQHSRMHACTHNKLSSLATIQWCGLEPHSANFHNCGGASAWVLLLHGFVLCSTRKERERERRRSLFTFWCRKACCIAACERWLSPLNRLSSKSLWLSCFLYFRFAYARWRTTHLATSY